jgi:hypothetical protein
MKIKPQTFFNLLVLVFFAIFVWQAKEWRIQARLFPWVIGVPMLVLAAIHFVMDLRGQARKIAPGDTPVDFQFAKDIDPVSARWRTINMFSWIVGFLAGIWLIGFTVTIPVVVFLYLKVQSREPWALSLVLTGIAFLVFWGLFDQMLHLPLPEGKIFTWLGL